MDYPMPWPIDHEDQDDSTRTSKVSMESTQQHCLDHQNQHWITCREIQKAIKHGICRLIHKAMFIEKK
jgi:hypothetical protein